MRINQNIAAFNSYRNLSSTNTVMGKSLEKLSSGFRINRAADDAAGLVISQGLRAQVSGLRQATRNAQDGISVVQTAEGALNEVHAMLNRMRDLAVQSVNASNDSDARTAANNEIEQLQSEITRIAADTKFGSQALLNGSFGAIPSTSSTEATTAATVEAGDGTADGNISFTVDGTSVTVDFAEGDNFNGEAIATAVTNAAKAALHADGKGSIADGFSASAVADGAGFRLELSSTGGTIAGLAISDMESLTATGATTTAGDFTSPALFQVGANAGETISVTGFNLSAVASSITGDVTTATNATAFISTMDTAIASVSAARGELGAVQNRFESTINNLQVTTENLAASESRIRDTDMALEMVSFTRHQILLQAGTAMLGQANQLPQSVLRLLG